MKSYRKKYDQYVRREVLDNFIVDTDLNKVIANLEDIKETLEYDKNHFDKKLIEKSISKMNKAYEDIANSDFKDKDLILKELDKIFTDNNINDSYKVGDKATFDIMIRMMNDLINKVNRKQFKDDDLWNKIFRLMSKFEQDIEYEFRKRFPTTVEYSFIMKDMKKALDEIGKKIYEKGINK